MRISTYTFSARSFMATKVTSVCDGRLHFTITVTCPSDCDMWDCFPLCCFTSTTFCRSRLWRFFNDYGTRPNSQQYYLQQRCAKWRLDAHGTILAFADHTDWWCQYRSWPWRIIHLFVVFWIVCFLVSSSRHELHIQNTFTSTTTANSAFHITRPNCETTSGNLASGFFLAWCATGLSRKIFVLVLRVVVTCLLSGVSLPRCA